MSIKPDADETTALARMGKTAEWELIKVYLDKRREAAVQASLSADPARSRQAQGMMMEIDDFIRNTTAAVESSTRR